VDKSFKAWIHEQESHERLANYAYYDGYYYNDHKIKVSKRIEKALDSDFYTVNNYCRPVIDTVTNYTASKPIAIEVLTDEKNKTVAEAAQAWLYSVYRRNKLLQINFEKMTRGMVKKGDSFLKAFWPTDEKGVILATPEMDNIVIKVLRPEIVFPRFKSDDYEEWEYCAVKWQNYTGKGELGANTEATWNAEVFYPDAVYYYILKGEDTTEFQWELDRSKKENPVKNTYGFIPIIHLKNAIDDLAYGVSDLQPVTPLQDALNMAMVNLVAANTFNSFQRVFVTGCKTQAGFVWEIGPATVKEIESPDATVTTIEPGDVTAILETIRQLESDIATVSQTPLESLAKTLGGGVPSGFALRVHYMPLEQKANPKRGIVADALKDLNSKLFSMLRMAGGPDYTMFDTEIHFQGVLPVDDVAEIEVAEREINAGIKSKRRVMQERGIEDTDAEQAQIDKERGETDFGDNLRAGIESEIKGGE